MAYRPNHARVENQHRATRRTTAGTRRCEAHIDAPTGLRVQPRHRPLPTMRPSRSPYRMAPRTVREPFGTVIGCVTPTFAARVGAPDDVLVRWNSGLELP